MLFGKKNIVPKDLKNALKMSGKSISYMVLLLTSVESSPEYFKEAKYINIVTIEKGSDRIGIL